MNIAIAICIALLIGVALGAVLHAQLAKKAAASKAELFAWTLELRTVVKEDTQAAKTRIEALIAKIENKL